MLAKHVINRVRKASYLADSGRLENKPTESLHRFAFFLTSLSCLKGSLKPRINTLPENHHSP